MIVHSTHDSSSRGLKAAIMAGSLRTFPGLKTTKKRSANLQISVPFCLFSGRETPTKRAQTWEKHAFVAEETFVEAYVMASSAGKLCLIQPVATL